MRHMQGCRSGWTTVCLAWCSVFVIVMNQAEGQSCSIGSFSDNGLDGLCPFTQPSSVTRKPCSPNKFVLGIQYYTSKYQVSGMDRYRITKIRVFCCSLGTILSENINNDYSAFSPSVCDVLTDTFPIGSADSTLYFSGDPFVKRNNYKSDERQDYYGNPCYGYRGFAIGYDLQSTLVRVDLEAPVIQYTHYMGFISAEFTPTSNSCPDGTLISGFYSTLDASNFIDEFGFLCMPRQCNPGLFSVNSATLGLACRSCPVGTYSPGNYQTSCIQCTIGTVNDDKASLTYVGSGGSTNSCPFKCNPGYGQTNTACPSTVCCKCNAGYVSSAGICAPCQRGTFAENSGMTGCISCTSGREYQDALAGIRCFSCASLTESNGYYIRECTVESNTEKVECPACPGGNYMSPACGGRVEPQCVQCPAGTIQPNAIPKGYSGTAYACVYCIAGMYQSNAGMSRCENCVNSAPADGSYAAWTMPSTTGTACPTQCNAGFEWSGTRCVRCTNGKFSVGGLIPDVKCSPCTPLTQNAYWLAPVLFNRSWSGCPWDCNAGYYKNILNNNCAPCANGVTYSSKLRLSDAEQANKCLPCSVCVNGMTFASITCSTVKDTVCSPCQSSCISGFYLTQCSNTSDAQCIPCKKSCASEEYMANLCTGFTTYDTVTCFACKQPTSCLSGLYMPANQCPGNTTRNSVCLVCQSLSCPFGTYQRKCSLNSDTLCIPYTQCNQGQTTLRNRGLTNDGVCLNCTNCSAVGLDTLQKCSQYEDTLCNGTQCSGASPCQNLPDRNYFCSMDALRRTLATREAQGVCGLCPDGYWSDGLFCYECPKGMTCSRLGSVQCVGEVLLGLEPGCFGEYAQPTGDPCPFFNDPTRIVTRSTFLRPNGTCAPYFDCAPGYYKHFYSTGLVTCDACDTNDMPVNYAWFSGGLSFNDPESCVYECVGRSTWPGGACIGFNLTTYVPANPAGYYDDGSGIMQQCPVAYTSLPGLAISPSDCMECFVPTVSLGDPCGAWTCPPGDSKRGGDCFNPTQCPVTKPGYFTSLGLCVAASLPWQKAGYQKIQANSLAGVSVTRMAINFTRNETVSAVVQTADGGTLVFISVPYGQSKRHWLAVNQSVQIALPARVCSATALGARYVAMAYCNTSFLSFVDLWLPVPRPRVLIGSSTPGYLEGFKNQALFQTVLYLASEANGTSLYVADTLNCVLRMVSIPTVPGDWVTRSYWLYGHTATICATVPSALLYPNRLFAVLDQRYWVFAASDGFYQLDSETRTVVTVLLKSQAPEWMPAPSLLLSAALEANTSRLILSFAATTAVLTPIEQPCDIGYTSLPGGTCTVPCSTSTNYVDPISGACLSCITRTCQAGEETVKCTPSSPQTCVVCPPLAPVQGKYNQIYNFPGSCALSNTLYVPPCPKGHYLSSTTVRGLSVCQECPLFSTTDADDAISVDQCRCFPGATKVAGGSCVVGQLYPLPTLSRCRFGTYSRGALETCSSCRLDPFPQCNLGQYPLSNGSCASCLLPAQATYTQAGRAVNAPTSCGFQCFPGFYPNSNTSYLTQCMPCTNAPNTGPYIEFYAVTNGPRDSPKGCTWACLIPFRISGGQCVLCTLKNPLHPGEQCVIPGLSVNASAGSGVQAWLNNVTYRLFQFNQSGYIQFNKNISVDLLVVGGGGAGGVVPPGTIGAGGGGGAGQVVMRYNVSLVANVTYDVIVGTGGAWVNWQNQPATSSSVAGVVAIQGGTGGAGMNTNGAAGSTGASGGGTGSVGTVFTLTGGTALAGFPGGRDTVGNMGAGGGGAGCAGGDSSTCKGGAGGCEITLWNNQSNTMFFPAEDKNIAGGGGGGIASQGCTPGTGGSSGGRGNGQSALPNTGAGGGGASSTSGANFMLGGNGGSGIVVLRYVDEPCVCAD